MCSKDMVDIFLARELDGVRILRNIKSVEVFDKAEVFEWGVSSDGNCRALPI